MNHINSKSHFCSGKWTFDEKGRTPQWLIQSTGWAESGLLHLERVSWRSAQQGKMADEGDTNYGRMDRSDGDGAGESGGFLHLDSCKFVRMARRSAVCPSLTSPRGTEWGFVQ